MKFAASLLALVLGTGVAHAETSPLLGSYNRDNVTLDCGLLTYAASASCTFHPKGIIYNLSGAVAGATGTGEQTPTGATYSLPANALDATGRRLLARAVWTHAANTNNCTFKLYFGSEVISSGTQAGNAKSGVFTTEVVKTGSSTQLVSQYGYYDTTNITPVVTAATETDTSAIVVKATVTGGTTGADCTISDFYVEYMN